MSQPHEPRPASRPAPGHEPLPAPPPAQRTSRDPLPRDPEPQLRRGTGRHAVTVGRRVPHPIAETWHGVTTTESLAQWFPGAPEIVLRTGGMIRFPEFAGTPAESGEVLECDAPHRLRFRWDTDDFAIDLQEEGVEATLVTFTHAFDDLAGAASFATGWEACLEGLAAVLERRQVPVLGPRRERHEELAERFGLGDPVLDEQAEGWQLRIERQLVCPAQTAWDLVLTGGDPALIEPPILVVGEALHDPRSPATVLGHVAEVQAPSLLVLEIAPGEPGEELRLELGPGTGHGARCALTVRGAVPRERAEASEHWTGVVRRLAGAALAAAPVDPTVAG